jgi:hypothetical protein
MLIRDCDRAATATAEPVTSEATQAAASMRFIAHFRGSSERIALCGASIAGIPAFGDFDLCVVCRDLRDQTEVLIALAVRPGWSVRV